MIDTATKTVTGVVNVGFSPRRRDHPDGSKLMFRTLRRNGLGHQHGDGHRRGNDPGRYVPAEVTPPTVKAYVSNYGINTVSVINTATDTVAA